MQTQWAYLVHLLGWGLPVLLLQVLFLVRHYRARTGAVLRAVLPPALAVGAYLSAADHVAIRLGVWSFGTRQHLGVYVGAVPLEEVAFFFVTSLLVAVGYALFTALQEVRRAAAGRRAAPGREVRQP